MKAQKSHRSTCYQSIIYAKCKCVYVYVDTQQLKECCKSTNPLPVAKSEFSQPLIAKDYKNVADLNRKEATETEKTMR